MAITGPNRAAFARSVRASYGRRSKDRTLGVEAVIAAFFKEPSQFTGKIKSKILARKQGSRKKESVVLLENW